MTGTNTPTLSAKDGDIWALWPDGRGAINLGNEEAFWAAAANLYDELHPETPERPEAATATAPQIDDRPSLPPAETRKQAERIEARHGVTIVGRVYGQGGSREATIFDLSAHGCRVEDRSLARPGSRVTIKIGSIGPLGAVIRWRTDDMVGLKFESPLYPSILEHIRNEVSLR
ncbi:PilZ domain-containing protein [Qipengyuania sp. XHP0211]|uniref:PilZ domain-containing protein n=1 Tax=Qipengyuania sp. XHP0211 TaxID=3038079 RepID=UPI00241EAE2A|nr:PilZ domain-containing protein [Qipengyuania sp. XHP0211]MDG5751400.1 PilZ domain-containing protein [Qipengyuania sp. XHP0211]